MRVEIWSDVICPWCYIGKRRFEKALEGFQHRDSVEVAYRSFQLDPTAPRGESLDAVGTLAAKHGIPEAQALAAMARVEEVARSEGLEYRLNGTRTGNTLDAHRVLQLAAEHGLQEAVLERLYRGHFLEGASVFDHDGLVGHPVELVRSGGGDEACEDESCVVQ